tara:strand:- start:74 stop:631 length:558 start_codon:yes stop_codon:yes gene_type:complete
MNRKYAISIAVKKIKKNPIISANGYISRDLFSINDKAANFYMIGSMGLASSIGLGIAIKNPKKRIFVFDGDGNILMNLGSLTTIGTIKPKNLIHLIFDNSSHESTGGQPTCTSSINIAKIAKAANLKVFQVENESQLKQVLDKIKNLLGPIIIVIKIKKSKEISGRVSLKPIDIKKRFMRTIVCD